jgi:hypothetical protein
MTEGLPFTDLSDISRSSAFFIDMGLSSRPDLVDPWNLPDQERALLSPDRSSRLPALDWNEREMDAIRAESSQPDLEKDSANAVRLDSVPQERPQGETRHSFALCNSDHLIESLVLADRRSVREFLGGRTSS